MLPSSDFVTIFFLSHDRFSRLERIKQDVKIFNVRFSRLERMKQDVKLWNV